MDNTQRPISSSESRIISILCRCWWPLLKFCVFIGLLLRMSLCQMWTSYWVEVRIKSGKTCRRQTWPQWNVDSQMKSLWKCETPGICCISSLFIFAFSFNCLVFKKKKKRKACLLLMTLKWCLPPSIEARDLFLPDNLGFYKPQCEGSLGVWYGWCLSKYIGGLSFSLGHEKL